MMSSNGSSKTTLLWHIRRLDKVSKNRPGYYSVPMSITRMKLQVSKCLTYWRKKQMVIIKQKIVTHMICASLFASAIQTLSHSLLSQSNIIFTAFESMQLHAYFVSVSVYLLAIKSKKCKCCNSKSSSL